MRLKKTIKQLLIRYSAYEISQNIYTKIKNQKLAYTVQKYRKTGNLPLPQMTFFEPTLRCNQRCKMCFQDRTSLSKQKELSLEQIVTFFDQNAYLKKVTLIGGEIFIRKDIIPLIQHLNKNHDLVLCTNGTLISDVEIQAIADSNGIYTISISLDSSNEKLYHSICRGRPEDFGNVLETIKKISQIVPVTVNCVIQDDNINILDALVDVCTKIGGSQLKLKLELERLYPHDAINRAIGELNLTPEALPFSHESRKRNYSLQTLKDKLMACKASGKEKGILVFGDPPYLLDHIALCYDNRLLDKKKCVCEAFRTATITSNGDVLHCPHIRKKLGNILESAFIEIWNSKKANAFRKELLENNMTCICENCPFMVPVSDLKNNS